MMRWINGRPRWWYGWSDLGPIQIPVLPPYIVLTDRADGTLWLLTWNATNQPPVDGLGYVSIRNDGLPTGPRVQTYGPFDGPTVGSVKGNVAVRLFVRGGFLGYDYQTGNEVDVGEAAGQIMAQKVNNHLEYRQVIVHKTFTSPTDTTPGSLLAWQQFINPSVNTILP